MVRIFLSLLAGVVALAAAGAATLPATASAAPDRGAAAKQPVTLGYYDGATVRYYDFGPIKLKPGNKLAPIWTVHQRRAPVSTTSSTPSRDRRATARSGR